MFTEKIFAHKIALEILAEFRCQKMIFRSVRNSAEIPRNSAIFNFIFHSALFSAENGKWKTDFRGNSARLPISALYALREL